MVEINKENYLASKMHLKQITLQLFASQTLVIAIAEL